MTPKSRMTSGAWPYIHQGGAAGFGIRGGVLKNKEFSDGV